MNKLIYTNDMTIDSERLIIILKLPYTILMTSLLIANIKLKLTKKHWKELKTIFDNDK